MRKLLLVLLLLLTACLPESTSTSHSWAAALRGLDPADTANPANDITAVYLRTTGDRLQIRIDLLDFQKSADLSLDIGIGDSSSPGASPFYIHLPTDDESARVTLDPRLATVIVEVPLSEIPAHLRMDVSTPEDTLTGLTLDGPVPTQAATLLLTFYNTFAARFPAEALRSWDGAHTGPRGERHGLKHLLDAVEEYQIPVALLDLKEPDTLSALDAMGLLPRIHRMEQQGLLILPDQSEGESLFGFSPSPFTWGKTASSSSFAFVSTDDPAHMYRPLFGQRTYLPIATQSDATQPTPDGPSLEVRRALLETVLNTDEKDLLVLGGSLAESTWGSPDMVSVMLAYFASHPYIHVLNAETLRTFPTQPDRPQLQPLPSNDSEERLEAHYQNLTRPVLDYAANWNGSSISDCGSDLDQDGQPECVLANQNYLAILDPQGARLTYLFAVVRSDSSSSINQLIGPSWQVAVGLSNSSQWDLSAGEAADPGAYPGAFADTVDPFKPYAPAIDGNTLVFTAQDGKLVKTFSLTDTGLQVEYQTQEPVTTQIPLLVNPDTRFTPGWAEEYTGQSTSDGVAWGLENGPMVNVKYEVDALRQAQGDLTLVSFNESLSLLGTPEDPDFEYPPGYIVPFPMAIAELKVDGSFTVQITIIP